MKLTNDSRYSKAIFFLSTKQGISEGNFSWNRELELKELEQNIFILEFEVPVSREVYKTSMSLSKASLSSGSNNPQLTYLLTYSAIDPEIFPTRQSFGEACAEAFGNCVDYYAVCK